MPIRVVLVDDQLLMHKMVSILLKETPDIELVGQGANGQDALDLCAQLSPDLVLMDVLMPGMDGLEATRRLHEISPRIKILALSSLQDYESIYDMLQNGATGYITKNSLADDLAETIRATFQGRMVFSSEAIAQLLAHPNQPGRVDYHLTEREMAVLALMAAGMNMPQIARNLNISQSTVKFHVENICHKFGVRTRSEALILAAKNNLV